MSTALVRPRKRLQTTPEQGILLAGTDVALPPDAMDYAAFRRWSVSGAYPEHGRIEYLGNHISIDVEMEEIYFHNQIRQQLNLVLGGFIDRLDLGEYYSDGARLVHPATKLSCEPDAMYASWDTLQSQRLMCEPNDRGHVMELSGTPDLVVEVLSNSSVRRDDVVKHMLYLQSGIAEYWLIDVRDENDRFDINRRFRSAWQVVAPLKGWSSSPVLVHDFRLVRSKSRLGRPKFTLECRPTPA